MARPKEDNHRRWRNSVAQSRSGIGGVTGWLDEGFSLTTEVTELKQVNQ